ncbi:MAG: hypothetical protein AB8C95_07375 [Phycisphaeraceae bacterium]
MELKAIKALTAAALLATATAASAGTAPFSMVSGATAPGVDVSLSVQQSSVPGYDYDFVVSNSSLMGIVTGVYFEMDWNGMLNGAGESSGPAALVSGSATPQIADWEGTKASHTVKKDRVRQRVGRHFVDFLYDNLLDGIQEGESQTFSFTTDTNIISLEDLQDMIGTDGYGVAVRMQGLTADEQATAWGEADEREQEIMLVQTFASVRQDVNTDNDDSVEVVSAPSPTAAIAGLVVAGIAGLRRRRK